LVDVDWGRNYKPAARLPWATIAENQVGLGAVTAVDYGTV